MATYRTRDGDILDVICIAHYGQAGRYVEAVLDANPGLAEQGPVLVSGTLIELPDLPELNTRNGTVEVQLDDRDGVIEWPRSGAELEVSLGYRESGVVRMGLYVVDEVEHFGPPATMIIRGKAADMRASLKSPKTRSWDNVTVGTLVQTTAAEHGLTARVFAFQLMANGWSAGLNINSVDRDL